MGLDSGVRWRELMCSPVLPSKMVEDLVFKTVSSNSFFFSVLNDFFLNYEV